ncbi:protein MpLOX3 [Marchantia polymorpha subsp. ruderalis]|uniref:Lipoxygenase n=2 Tax=Marchantia polymorpha TaxID=3197 RepID=A0AAF6AY28_MARPO|nr:hypothetical protein MARPO_0006s0130 [Marchantia polymorpha]BBN04662.1 hypothetical protein Mp_3g06610 [Marchantia polymorpha subsp. ruderalis]|eukprot:PTQ48100.1 hypothetical protein MARPO_0006s0130 [Marchantia polymorpha]
MLSVRAPFRISAHAVAPSNPCATPSACTRSSVCSKSSSLMGTAVQCGPHENSMSQQLPQGYGKSLHPVRASLRDLVPDPLHLFDHKKDQVQVEGELLISNRTVLDFDQPVASLVDKNVDLLGLGKIQFQLVSEDLDKNGKPKLTEAAVVENYALSNISPLAGQKKYRINFQVDPDFGKIGAVVVRNSHLNEFFLHSLSLKLAGGKVVDFFCNSWVNPESYELQFRNGINYTPLPDRVFFLNKACLPEDTPAGLKAYREEDLKYLKGTGKGMRVFSDRIYDYDVYNDLGKPDSYPPVMRPVLGGDNLPYPRRCRTGRGYSSTKNPAVPSDPPSEKEMGSEGIIALGPLVGLMDFYVPCDEFFGGEKTSAFLAVGLKSVAHSIVPILKDLFTGDRTAHFDSIQDFKDLYAKGVKIDTSQATKDGPLVFVDSFFNASGDDKGVLKFPVPQVFAKSDFAWNEDEELGRQTLAGLNPVVIQALTQYPPKSTLGLPEDVYGPNSVLTDEHILPYLEGLSVQQAIDAKKLFIIDYHDPFAVYLPKILSGKWGDKKRGYAPRAIFFYNKEGAMMPIAIELSKPEGSTFKHTVYTPPLRKGDINPYWNLAKAHFNAIDFGYHELISHWLRTHAVMEPFVIATRRQLSTIHPIYSLLIPCFKNTMMINAAARVALINSNGIIESYFLPGEYSMEMSAVMYGLTWTFEKQALPNDLISRGMAVPDETEKAGVKLVIDDYPFAEDALDLWAALHDWITEYVNIAYKSDEAVRGDTELQAWWNEIVTVGHADIKTGWPKADSRASLVDICCTIHWIAGPHHAAVNFGQYSYAGFMPNKPSTCLRWIPDEGTAEAQELEQNPFLYLLKTVATELITLPIMTTVELLAQHGTDEEYLGDRNDLWTSDPLVQQAFKKHSERIAALQSEFEQRNSDSTKRNRSGPTNVPYTLLYPHSGPGLTGRGVPNSISI